VGSAVSRLPRVLGDVGGDFQAGLGASVSGSDADASVIEPSEPTAERERAATGWLVPELNLDC